MKLNRLLGILTVLLQTERATAPQLAQKFEVSRRTISRDIDALCMAGIPIVTNQGIGGGISIAEGFKFDKTVLTVDELSGIIAALKGIGSVSNKSQIEGILDKLGADKFALQHESIFINLASFHKEQLTEKIEKIKYAISKQQIIEFDYYSEKGESRRRLEPHHVYFEWSSWYVLGFCLTRQDWRMFKLTRLWNLMLCADKFELREIPSEMDETADLPANELKLVALFDPSEKYKLVETYGLGAFSESGGGLRFEMTFTDRRFLLRWLLGFGEKVRVLEPKDIIDDLKFAAKNILSLYK